MRGDRNHLRLVGTTPEVSASVVETGDGAKVIAVRLNNVREGQICEVLHGGVFALSNRVVVPEARTSVAISTFALKQGRYDISVRIDGAVDETSDSQLVIVDARPDRPKSTASSTRPASATPRVSSAAPRRRPHGRTGRTGRTTGYGITTRCR